MANYLIRFLPDNKEVRVESGQSLLDATRDAGIQIKSTCGGLGTCGRCRVIVKEGNVTSKQSANLTREELAEGYVLACQSFPESDLVIEIPEESRLTEHQVYLKDEGKTAGLLTEEKIKEDLFGGHPLYHMVVLNIEPPSLDDNRDDLSRLMTEIRKETGIENLQIGLDVTKKIAKALRDGNWQVTVHLTQGSCYTEIADIEPGEVKKPIYGLAVDIGTTTVVVHLVDLRTGETIDVKGTYNKQAVYGDDVISRIIHAVENKDGLQELHEAVVNSINEMVDALLKAHNIDPNDVRSAVFAGNTTMNHLFLGVDPKYIRLEPYIPTLNSIPPVRAKEIGIHIHPEAWLHCTPNVASYVGGDITSGAMVTGMAHAEEITLFIDIGTNGEMVLGNQEWLVTVACSAGPAFEGGGIKYGMRAMKGAIERVEISKDFEVRVSTIGNAKAIGICGSGLIDTIAKLRDAGIIDRTGKFVKDINTPRVREGDEGKEFVLVWAKDAGGDDDITISEADIKTLIHSKGAIFAGIRVMLGLVDLPLEAIDRILIAGGFGNYINIHDAITIGMLPDLPVEKYRFIGNSSVKGAKMALLSSEARREVEEIAKKMTYLELSVGNAFMDEYVSALFLPHTDLTLFPSVKD